jgi:hypothetical protein
MSNEDLPLIHPWPVGTGEGRFTLKFNGKKITDNPTHYTLTTEPSVLGEEQQKTFNELIDFLSGTKLFCFNKVLGTYTIPARQRLDEDGEPTSEHRGAKVLRPEDVVKHVIQAVNQYKKFVNDDREWKIGSGRNALTITMEEYNDGAYRGFRVFPKATKNDGMETFPDPLADGTTNASILPNRGTHVAIAGGMDHPDDLTEPQRETLLRFMQQFEEALMPKIKDNIVRDGIEIRSTAPFDESAHEYDQATSLERFVVYPQPREGGLSLPYVETDVMAALTATTKHFNEQEQAIRERLGINLSDAEKDLLAELKSQLDQHIHTATDAQKSAVLNGMEQYLDVKGKKRRGAST